MASPIIVTMQGLIADRMKGGAPSGGAASSGAAPSGSGSSPGGMSCPHCGEELSSRLRRRGGTLLGGTD